MPREEIRVVYLNKFMHIKNLEMLPLRFNFRFSKMVMSLSLIDQFYHRPGRRTTDCMWRAVGVGRKGWLGITGKQ